MVDPILMGLALGAGLISFSSPCALPLLPAYAVYFMGQNYGTGEEGQKKGVLSGLLAALGILTILGSLGILRAS